MLPPELRFVATDERIVNTQSQDDQRDAAIAKLAGGGFVVAWTDMSWRADGTGGGVKAQIYDAAGNPVGGEFLVNTETNSTQSGASVVGLPGGGFAVAWTDISGFGGDGYPPAVKLQIYDAAGARVGGEVLVTTTTFASQHLVSMAATANGLVLTWTDTSATGGDTSGMAARAQLFDFSGNKIGPEFLVNDSTLNDQRDSVVAALPGGGFVISWTDFSRTGEDSSLSAVRAQLFDASGAKVGGEMLVNTTVLGAQATPAVAAGANGGFLIAWRDASTGVASLRAQLFDGTGIKTGSELVIASGYIAEIRAAALPTGEYLLSWSSTTVLDGNGSAITGQLSGAAGDKLGDPFLINGSIAGNQNGSAITVLSDGTLAAAWTDRPDSWTAEIRMRLFVTTERPVARGDQFVTDEISTVGGNLFANNGSGADRGSTLQVVAVDGSAASVGRQIILASGAKVTVNADGTFSYDPAGAHGRLVPKSTGAANHQAFDTLTYTLPGGSTATVTIRVDGLFSAQDEYHDGLGIDHIVGTDGANRFFFGNGYIDGPADYLQALGGDDLIFVAWLRPEMALDGGAGNDSLLLYGSANVTLAPSNLVGIESLILLSSLETRVQQPPDRINEYTLYFPDNVLEAGRTLIVDAKRSRFRLRPPRIAAPVRRRRVWERRDRRAVHRLRRGSQRHIERRRRRRRSVRPRRHRQAVRRRRQRHARRRYRLGRPALRRTRGRRLHSQRRVHGRRRACR